MTSAWLTARGVPSIRQQWSSLHYPSSRRAGRAHCHEAPGEDAGGGGLAGVGFDPVVGWSVGAVLYFDFSISSSTSPAPSA